MTVSLFENPLFPLFGDPDLARLFSAEHTLSLYRSVERALTLAAAAERAVDEGAARAALAAIDAFDPEPSDLAEKAMRDGIPLPAYVAALKATADPAAHPAIHPRSTSQDIMDNALALVLLEGNDIIAARIKRLEGAFDALRKRFGGDVLMGRTRMQAALPIRVDARIEAWRATLTRAATRFTAARDDVEWLQLGGPVGTRDMWDGKDDAIALHMAETLGLFEPRAPFHTGRDGIVAYGTALSAISAALGKFGVDLVLMAQQGLDEVEIEGGGGSSAMAHKKNPVAAEALVSLARYSAAQLAALQQAAVAEQERSGIAWALEWLALPPLVMATGVGLLRAHELASRITRLGTPP